MEGRHSGFLQIGKFGASVGHGRTSYVLALAFAFCDLRYCSDFLGKIRLEVGQDNLEEIDFFVITFRCKEKTRGRRASRRE